MSERKNYGAFRGGWAQAEITTTCMVITEPEPESERARCSGSRMLFYYVRGMVLPPERKRLRDGILDSHMHV